MLHRFPTGVSGDKVHQKRVPAGAPPWLGTVRLYFPRYGQHADELCVTELAEVIWAVQMSTVEFHPWNSRRADTEMPDEWRIDLDPMPECSFYRRSVESPVLRMRCSTSSEPWDGRRRRVVAASTSTCASNPTHGFTDVRRAALAFAREVERRAPADVTTTWWRKDRDPASSSSTTTRTRATTRWPPPTPCAVSPMLASRHRSAGTRSTTSNRLISPSAPCPPLHPSRRSARGHRPAVFRIDELLEWAARDDRAGEVDPGDTVLELVDVGRARFSRGVPLRPRLRDCRPPCEPSRRSSSGTSTRPPSRARIRSSSRAIVVGWLALGLALDDGGGIGRQRLIGAATWLLLIVLVRREPRVTQIQVATLVVLATLLEYSASPLLGLYTYRLHNVPAFVPPGHGLVYLAAVLVGTSAAVTRRPLRSRCSCSRSRPPGPSAASSCPCTPTRSAPCSSCRSRPSSCAAATRASTRPPSC